MLKRFLVRFFLIGFAVYGGIWTVIESLSVFIERLKPSGLLHYVCLLGVSAFVGIWRAWPSASTEIAVPNSDSSVAIEFGDIFKKTGCIAIQVNDFFDSVLGDHISPNSLHGKFIRDILGGLPDSFNRLVAQALSGVPHEQVVRSSGNTLRYKIGTTASVDVNGRRFLLFAFSRTDVATLKVSATIHDLWDALAGLWDSARIRSNGAPLYVSLLGSGQSGVGLPAKTLLHLLLVSFFYHTKKHKVTNKLTVVLDPRFRFEIDLASVQEQLE